MFSAFVNEVLSIYGMSKAAEAFKDAGAPPPLPAAARAAMALKKVNPMADALFSGMKSAPKANVLSSLVKKGAEKAPEKITKADKRLIAKVEKKYPDLLKKAGLMENILHDPGHHKQEIAGLATLMAAPVDQLQAHGRAALARDYNKDGVKKRELLPHVAHPALEAAGLGILMGPSIKGLRGHA